MQGITPQKIKLSEYKLMEERRRKEIFIHGGQQKAEDESRPGRKDEDAAPTIEATPEQVSSLVEDRLKEIKKELHTESVAEGAKKKGRKKAVKQNHEGDKDEKDGRAVGKGGGKKSKRKVAREADSYFEGLSEEEKRSLVADHLAGESSRSAEVDTQRSAGEVEGPSSDSVDNGKD